ncbi:asparagine synthase [Cladochytrium replicatum]|nr:asparagine synthase [Cladochytrium replicatum]
MCGIFAVFGFNDDALQFRKRAVALSKKVRHRGPDWSGVMASGSNILCHERFAIVGVGSGAQPLSNSDDSIILSKDLKTPYPFKTESDCEVIIPLYEQHGENIALKLDGMFAFVLYDQKNDVYLAARDHIGITTLYQGWRKSDNSVWFASEMKALHEDCDRIIAFPPGHYFVGKPGDPSSGRRMVQYYNPQFYSHLSAGYPSLDDELKMYTALRTTLEAAVKKRLMSEVPYGVLLSGGLDSSLIASITMRMRYHLESLSGEASPVYSFSIGLEGSPDLKAGVRAAEFLKTEHHEFTFTIDEGLDAIADVIYHLETYDVTTVRASTPMYLLSRKIKALGVKMVLSGEGSHEIFGGYLYFHDAPSAQSLHHECIARIQNLHTSDCLRANKATMAWGLEARVPFLDKAFLDVAMAVPANHKTTRKAPYNHHMEKYVIRKAFDTPENPYLPHEILWRQKEQFSDGVGYSWIDSLKDHAEEVVSDEHMKGAAARYQKDTPTTKEAYWYRTVFEKYFPEPACLESVVRWIPRKDWGCAEDPSGRAQKAHLAAYEKVQQ